MGFEARKLTRVVNFEDQITLQFLAITYLALCRTLCRNSSLLYASNSFIPFCLCVQKISR
jgi:hypothetical protein